MIPLEEGDHVYNSVIKDTGIDPEDRQDEIKANQRWLLAMDNLRKVGMANQNIRVPKEGVTANSKRIARAVDDQKWQEFRVSLKGKSTQTKLDMLAKYYADNHKGTDKEWLQTVEIRIDNYLKALARGGQLNMGVSLQKALESGGIAKLPVKKG